MSQHPPEWDQDAGSLQFENGPPSAAHSPLPAWGRPVASSRIPPFGRQRPRSARPRLETVLKAAGVLLILTAMVAAVILAMPSRNSAITPTVTVDPVLVIAASGTEVAIAEGTPDPAGAGDGLSIEARYRGMVICLDPGHGGQDRGHQRQASASAPAMDESHFNLTVANALRDRLEQRGFEVVMTRAEDVESNVSGLDTNLDGSTRASGSTDQESIQFGEMDETQARIDRCNDAKAAMMVSIHFDGSSNAGEPGSKVWYSAERTFSPQNQLLATLLNADLELALVPAGLTGIGQSAFSESHQATVGDEHIDRAFLALGPEHAALKEPSAMPGVVAEVLTITDDNGALFLSSDGGLKAIVAAFDRAIVQYVDMNQPE
ncbi:hypothetical protein BH24CHL4_BH24CHL4_12030 [soil metagenome]